jgi:hypothetical protein
MIIKDASGAYYDLATGEKVGGAEPQPVSSPSQARQATPRSQEVETTGAQRVTDLVKNFSWGFNAGLFALPDAAQRAIGKGLGLSDDETFQFTKFFNRGEQAPKNIGERFARATGEGASAGLPITGVLAAFALKAPAVKAAEPGAGVLKGIANDAISFIQKYPKAALATDVAFGAAYEGFRQAVEETVDPNDPYKQIYKDLLPMGAFLGLPAAISYLPSVQAARFAKNKMQAASANLGEIESGILKDLPGIYQMPVVRVVPKLLMKNAERKLAQVFGPINESKEAQEALRLLDNALADPRIAEAGFMFDAAERTLYAPLLERKAELLKQLGPKEIGVVKNRISENQRKLDELFNTFAPDTRKQVADAFTAAQQDRQSFFEALAKQKKDLTEAEVMAVSERLGPQNLDMLNDELRGVLMANMEMGNKERQMILDSLGLRVGTSPEGLPMPTREGGKSLFPAKNIEAQAQQIIEKYKIERPSLRAGLPEPVRLLDNFVRTQQIARDRAAAENLDILIKKAIDDELAGGRELPPELYDLTLKNAKALFTKKGTSKKVADQLARELNLQRQAGIDVATMKEGQVAVATGLPGKPVYINPKQIQEDAARLAEEATGVDLNLPEALDYIQAAIRFRNDSLARYNAAMSRGRARVTDAQRFLDTGDAVYNDIEKLVLGSVVDREQANALKSALDSYRKQFEKNLPLLTTRETTKGEYLLPNEDLMRRSFSNAGNLRQLQTSLQGTAEGESLLQRGAMDWLRSKNVVDKDGLVDPRKMRQVLGQNQNIVDALPANIQQRFQDELQMADDFIARLGQLDQRKTQATNNELDQILTKAARPDADPRASLEQALKDPAKMRVLVDQFGKDPENLAALRRAVYDVATEGTQGGGALKIFIDRNEKSLQVLFKDTKHLENLKTLADLQRRVNAFADITGQIPAFESLDDTLRRMFGSGIQWLTTTAREAAVGRINPTTGALAMMVRLAGSLENSLYQRIFTKALEDPKFASSVVKVGTPQEAATAAAQLSKIGISPTAYLPQRVVPLKAEAADVAKEAGREPRPAPAPAPVPPAFLNRPLPPAAPSRGTGGQLPGRLPAVTPQPTGPTAAQMYMSLFPNDPLSAMLQARQSQSPTPGR